MEPHQKVNPPTIARCAQCGNDARHSLAYREDYSEVIDETEEGEPMYDERWLAILVCETCRKPSVYHDEWDEQRRRWVPAPIYPEPLRIPREVPAQLRTHFLEAASVIDRTPDMSAVAVGVCLEAICKEQRAEGKDLNERIETLRSRGVLPESLIELMHAGRLLRNIGAHFDGATVTLEQARALLEFTAALFDYLYVAPAKVERLRKRLLDNEARA